MELNWSTFLLEIVNFLLLVWILKHFFYRPVQAAIERRRRAIAATTERAAAVRKEAEALQAQYEGRLRDWEAERQQAREGMQRELNAERTRQLSNLEGELAREREKSEVLDQRRREEAQESLEKQAIAQGGSFAARLLRHFADEGLQEHLLGMLVAELPALPAERLETLKNRAGAGFSPKVKISSAFPLSEEQRRLLAENLDPLLAGTLPYEYRVDQGLIAGLAVTIGPLVLRANIRDELQLFTEAAHGRN